MLSIHVNDERQFKIQVGTRQASATRDEGSLCARTIHEVPKVHYG